MSGQAALLVLLYVVGAWVGLSVLLGVGWGVFRWVQRRSAGLPNRNTVAHAKRERHALRARR